jgi:hypothetical protein
MQTNPAKKTLLQKQIPTIIGLLVLVVALVAGVFFLGDTRVFAPRATPETTPTNIKVTNVTDSGFTISFLTAEATAGFVKYGESASDLQSQSSDDRDQLAGTIGQYQSHHITVRGLKPGTPYYYTLGTGSRASFDDSGKPFMVTTAKRAGAPSAAKTAYGSVVTAAGGPADGAIVYVAIQGVGEMSSLVKSSGSYAIALSNARTADGSSYAQVADTDTMAVLVQGTTANQTSSFNVTVAESQPVATVTLGQTPDLSAAKTTTEVDDTQAAAAMAREDESSENATASESARTMVADGTGTTATGGSDILSQFGAARSSTTAATTTSTSTTASKSATTASASTTNNTTTTASSSARVVDLESTKEQIVTSTMPVITGKAAPSVKVTIEVHSDTQIKQELTTDANGNFVLDIEKLKTQLEPGEHTATYSYTDPTTNELVTKTVTFTVDAPKTTTTTTSTTSTASTTGVGGSSTSTQLALASTSPSPTPYGSGNPVPVSTASATATASSKPATRSGMPATNSAVPVSGSVGTTFALLLGGFFFITAGTWSYWAAREYGQVELEN